MRKSSFSRARRFGGLVVALTIGLYALSASAFVTTQKIPGGYKAFSQSTNGVARGNWVDVRGCGKLWLSIYVTATQGTTTAATQVGWYAETASSSAGTVTHVTADLGSTNTKSTWYEREITIPTRSWLRIAANPYTRGGITADTQLWGECER